MFYLTIGTRHVLQVYLKNQVSARRVQTVILEQNQYWARPISVFYHEISTLRVLYLVHVIEAVDRAEAEMV